MSQKLVNEHRFDFTITENNVSYSFYGGKLKTELKYGLLISLAGFGWVMLEYLFGFHDRFVDAHAYVVVLGALGIPAYGLWLTLKEKQTSDYRYIGPMKFGQGVKAGVLTSLVAGVTGIFFSIIFSKLLSSHWPEFMASHLMQFGSATATSGPTGDLLANATPYFSIKSYFLQSFLTVFIVGGIISLFLSAILTKKKFTH